MSVRPFNFKMSYRVFGLFQLELPMVLTGGPYPQVRKVVDYAVNLKAEASLAEAQTADMNLPIRDFSVPKSEQDTAHAVEMSIRRMLAGDSVGAGCMGGTGRTGLLFALIAKTAGYKSPVTTVRQHYKPHAVETAEQEDYVTFFDVEDIREDLFWPFLKAWIGYKLRR